jgi:hypothetical protein
LARARAEAAPEYLTRTVLAQRKVSVLWQPRHRLKKRSLNARDFASSSNSSTGSGLAAILRLSGDGAAALEGFGLEERAPRSVSASCKGRNDLPWRQRTDNAGHAAWQSARYLLRGCVRFVGAADRD